MVCEVCQEPIVAGEAMVIAQQADGVVMVGLLDSTADGPIAAFHESHWPDRIGTWQERDRGQAK